MDWTRSERNHLNFCIETFKITSKQDQIDNNSTQPTDSSLENNNNIIKETARDQFERLLTQTMEIEKQYIRDLVPLKEQSFFIHYMEDIYILASISN
jgi:hypothetical protein